MIQVIITATSETPQILVSTCWLEASASSAERCSWGRSPGRCSSEARPRPRPHGTAAPGQPGTLCAVPRTHPGQQLSESSMVGVPRGCSWTNTPLVPAAPLLSHTSPPWACETPPDFCKGCSSITAVADSLPNPLTSVILPLTTSASMFPRFVQYKSSAKKDKS